MTLPKLGPPQPVTDHRRWWALAAVATAQLMIGLDLTVMNIALPTVQTSLGLSDPGRQWVITAFALGGCGTPSCAPLTTVSAPDTITVTIPQGAATYVFARLKVTIAP